MLNNPIVNTCPHGSSPPRITHKKCPSFICFNAAGCNSRRCNCNVSASFSSNNSCTKLPRPWASSMLDYNRKINNQSLNPTTHSFSHPHLRSPHNKWHHAMQLPSLVRSSSKGNASNASLPFSISNTKLHHHGLAVEIAA